MTTALVVGVGAVGTRAARQLIDTAGIDRLLLADRDREHLAEVADALGADAQAIDFAPGDPIPSDVDVVATALPAALDHDVVTAAIDARIPIASSDDEHDAIEQLRALSPNAKSADVTVAIGCGLAPGLADVLAAHASAMFEKVDEIRVARTGWGGPASVNTVRHERRVLVHTWHDGSWREEHPHGDSLVWFPEPIGGRDCRMVTGGTTLLVDAFGDVPRLSVQLGEPPRRTRFRRRFGDEGEWGAARVDVWGRRDGTLDCVVYGVVERTAVAAGTVLAIAAAGLAAVIEPRLAQPGVHGLAALVPPVPFLAELAQRGVRGATFEGVAVA
jgi:siroheme synthase (precorrin-2 oxidase/ferrochelatase)